MFQARPISLSIDVWDRIDAYLNQKASEDRTFKPNRSAFIEEAVVAFLDAADGGGSNSEADSLDGFDFGSSLESTDESTEASSDDSSDTEEFDLDSLLASSDEESSD